MNENVIERKLFKFLLCVINVVKIYLTPYCLKKWAVKIKLIMFAKFKLF